MNTQHADHTVHTQPTKTVPGLTQPRPLQCKPPDKYLYMALVADLRVATLDGYGNGNGYGDGDGYGYGDGDGDGDGYGDGDGDGYGGGR